MQFRDLKTQYLNMKNEIDKNIQDVINSSNFILGEEVVELENVLSNYVGRKHCITCANGTDALQLAQMSYGVKEGDAVFTSDFTYIASAGSASILGATPIFVDISLDTFNISPEALEISIQSVIKENKLKPKAIIPVDLFGQPANYNEILSIAKKYNLIVIEDAAQSFGGRINNRLSCSFGDISTTSFFPAKPLGCYGDGGAIFTDDDKIADRLRSLRAQGKSKTDKYDNIEIGMNSRLDTLQAAILLAKFKKFVEFELDSVNNVAQEYDKYLNDYFITPKILPGYYSSWAQYTILFKNKKERDNMKLYLKDNGIPTMVYYPKGLHQQVTYSYMNLTDDLYPNTCNATECCLSLPMHPYLDMLDIEKICSLMIKKIKE